MSKKLQKQIEKKLTQLEKIFKKVDEARVINSDDPDTWDSDTLYNLVENLKESLQLLEDKKQTNRYGEETILAVGLCSLVDDWENDREEKETDD